LTSTTEPSLLSLHDALPICPEEVPFRFNVDAAGNLVSAAAGLQESADAAQALKRSDIILDNPAANCGGIGHEGQKSLWGIFILRSEEHTSELQSREKLVCRL